MMKNITVSVDEATHRLIRIRAAELDTSVSALVRGYLRRVAGELSRELVSMERVQEDEFERRRQQMNEVIEEITVDGGGLRMADNLTREELYDRAGARTEAREKAAVERKNTNAGERNALR